MIQVVNVLETEVSVNLERGEGGRGIVPVALPVNLIKVNPLRLNTVFPREPVTPGQTHPCLPMQVTQGGGEQHMEAPVIHLMASEEIRLHCFRCERKEQCVLQKSKQ